MIVLAFSLALAAAEQPLPTDACPSSLADLNCAKAELRVEAPAGHQLAGEVLLPKGRASVPLVMLISGSGRQSRDFDMLGGAHRPHRDIARALLAAGIGVIRFDERSTGASTGDHRAAHSADLRNDARLIFRAASRIARVDRTRMYIFGHSEGAVFAMQLAAEEALVAGIAISGAPFKSGREMTMDQVRVQTPRRAEMDDTTYAQHVQRAFDEKLQYVLSRPALADLLDYDGAATAARVRRPALIFEGQEDWQVRPPQGQQIAEAMRRAGNRHVRFLSLPNLGHLLTPNPAGVTDYDQLRDYAVDRRVTAALVGWVRSVRR